MIDDELIKGHLRLEAEEFDAQATTLRVFARAAWRLVEGRTRRKLVDVGTFSEGVDPQSLLPPDAPANALALDDDVTLAILLLVADWHATREAAAAGAMSPAVEALLEQHKRWRV